MPKPPPTSRDARARAAGRKRLVFWLILLGLVVAAILFLRCRGSLGLGGSGNEPTRQRQPTGQPARLADTPADAALPRCQLRLDATGLTIAGNPGEIGDAIAACKPPRAADLIVTGDANFGAAQDLEAALKTAGIEVYRK